MATISIRNIEAKPGQKTSAGVTCGEWADGSPVQVHVSVANGAQEGPVFMALGCTHGDEMVGAEAIRRIMEELDPAQMRGAFIGVPNANATAYIRGERVHSTESPTGANDLKKLLRTGSATGSLTERMAAFLRDEVAPYCEYYADLHSSAIGSTNYPRAIVAGDYAGLSPELMAKIETLGDACNLEYIFRARPEEYDGMYLMPTHALEQDHGKAGIVLETGHAPTFEGVEVLVDSLRSILRRIGILEGPSERTLPLTYMDRLVATRANLGGIWHPAATIPDTVAKGDLLGRVLGLDGSVREEILSPVDGVIIKVATTATLSTGVRTHVIGVPAGAN